MLALVALLSAAATDSDVELYKQFRDYMETHEKKYDGAERANRFENFKTNLKKIEALNKQSRTAKYGINQFTDMSAEEFSAFPCGVKNMGDLSRHVVPAKNAEMVSSGEAVPTEWDWTTKGAVTAIKNQGQCGSCWAFSTVANTEGVWFLGGHTLTSLSEQMVVDCSTTDYGCQGGWPFWAFGDIITNFGGHFDTEESYPYTAMNGQCDTKSAKVGATVANYTNWCNEQTQACSEESMMEHLVKVGPLSVCLNAESMQSYSGGIDDPQGCDPSAIDHCVTLVGYGTDSGTDFWKIKNSWGTGWGEQGYYRLKRGEGLCGINAVVTTAALA